MKPSIEMEFEFAYNCWKEKKEFDNETAKSLRECMDRTAGSEIDRVAEKYDVAFLKYIDERIAQV